MEQTVMSPLGDDVGVLLQTYDALEAFLREMDALDGDGEFTAVPFTAAPACGPPSSWTQSAAPAGLPQQLTAHMWSIKTESSANSTNTVTISKPTTLPGSRKRRFETRTSAVVTLATNATDSGECTAAVQERPARRRRQKDELLLLRQQAIDMETQLQQLKASVPAARAPVVEPATPGTQQWERRATRARQHKLSAEQENARLRDLTRKELKVSFEIEKMLVKCYTSALAFLPFGKNEELALEARDVLLYETLEQNADARYRALEHTDIALAVVSPTSHESRIVRTGDEDAGVEFTRSEIVPFDSDSVRDVSWRTMAGDDAGFFTCKNVRVSDNMIAIHARFTIHCEREGDIELDAHHVFKRFCTDKRTTLTWEGVTQWKVASESAALCLPTRETGWGVFEPVPNSGSTPVTMSKVTASTLPTRPSGSDAGDVASLLRELIIPAMEQVFVAHRQIMENALLDDSLRRK